MQTVDANKRKIGPAEALRLLDDAERLVVVVRGKTIQTFELPAERPDDATLIALMIGPTGNLRAPTVRIGTTLVVGYNDEAYRQLLGRS